MPEQADQVTVAAGAVASGAAEVHRRIVELWGAGRLA
jgi:hypothetical protein